VARRLVNRRRLLGSAVTLGAGAAALAGPLARPAAAAGPSLPPMPYRPTPVHLAEAQYITDYLRLAPPGNNTYKDATDANIVTWGTPGRPETWRIQAQCASFVTAVLRRSYPGWADRFLADNFDSDSPYARDYQRVLANPPADYLRPVPRVADLLPGDLVAIDYDNHQTTDTGHVVIVRAVRAPYTSPAGSLNFPGEIQYPVEVVDCTSDPHGLHDKPEYPIFPDTRLPTEPLAAGPIDDGAGYGHLMFYASAATGAFTRYRWSVNSSSAHTYTVAERPIAAARVVPAG
jgi:hypothetical protein